MSETKSQPALPAYFLSVSLENVRCFGPKQTLDLSDGNGRPAQWTVILGDNGTGKTTLLQIFVFSKRFVGRNIENSTIMSSMFRPGGRGFPSVREGHEYAEVEALYGIGAKVSEKREARYTARANHEVLARSGIESITYDDILRKHELHFLCCAYGASRRMSKTSLPEDHVDLPTKTLISDDWLLFNAEEWMLQLDYALSRTSGQRKKEADRRKKQVTDVLIQLLPDVEEIRLVEPEESQLVPHVEFKTPYGWVRIDQLSLGYRTMIAWTVDVARRLFQRYPDSPNPLAEPAVVLVDEIDLHLHPRWQRDLIPFLSERFPNTQFIVTAHSPLIVQAAADANIMLLRREGDHVVIEQDLQPIRNLRVDQILTSELYGLESARPPQIDDLLEQRRTLLSKPKLTAEDREALHDIEEKIGPLPAGETPEEMEAMDIIRRAAERLKPDA